MPQSDPVVPCNHLVALGELNGEVEQTTIEFASGRKIRIATGALLAGVTASQPGGEAFSPKDVTSQIIPVIAEEMVITRRQVPTESVRLVKSSEVTTERTEVSLTSEHWAIERVPRDTEVAERFDVRQAGDVTIYPVFEERVITRKALFLTEELHVRKVLQTTQEIVEASLVRESVTVERTKL